MDQKRRLEYEAAVAVSLSFIGGVLDVYCLFNYNVYAMLHTGNIIKLVTNLVDGDYWMFLDTLLVVGAFAVGIYLANVYEHHRRNGGQRGLLLISIALMVAAALIPNDCPPRELSVLKMAAATIFGLEGAFLVHSFVRFGDYTYSATTMTANINRLVTNIYRRVTTKNKAHNYGITVYLFIFAFFMLGVGVGYCYLHFLPEFRTGFMSLYGYNLILLAPIACMFLLLAMTARRDRN